MKKILSIVALATVVLTGCGSKSTVYTGTAKGYGGDVTVEVKVDEAGAVTDIAVDASSETPTVGGEAAPVVAESIKEKQSLNVDTVSGATVTSNAVIEAAKAALQSGNVTFDGAQ